MHGRSGPPRTQSSLWPECGMTLAKKVGMSFNHSSKHLATCHLITCHDGQGITYLTQLVSHTAWILSRGRWSLVIFTQL